MIVNNHLEERLSAVERVLSDVQRRLDSLTISENWLDKIKGSFKDEPAFDEVIELGRAFRAAEFPFEENAP
jgi:hypothetical protein